MVTNYNAMQSQNLKIMVVVAHPHDFTHCAGTCGIHRKLGDAVTVVAITNGGATHNEKLSSELLKPESERDPAVLSMTPEAYEAQKQAEFRKACSYFDVADIRFLSAPDPFRVNTNHQAVHKLRDIILDVRPEVVITHSPYLNGYNGRNDLAYAAPEDHTEVAFAYSEAAMLAGTPNYKTKAVPHSVAAVYYMGVFCSPNQVDFHIDVSDWFEQRVAAEAAFATQGHDETFARTRMVTDIGHQGWFSGTQYAEGFLRARRELLTHIVVPERALKQAKSSHMKHLAWISGKKGAENV
ncbi:MAG: PIG-L family deacetylase [Kiritimatiellaeota bacterium]|nr:PIG-L family deacetylase [Kiritimatiellota bacterium]